VLWLGQNLRNRVLLSEHPDLKAAPLLVSLGDAYLRPTLFKRFFHEHLRESLGMEGPIMVDSGGFTLLSRRHLKFDVSVVERIYRNLEADILVSLDNPPLPDDDLRTKKRLLGETLKNLKRLLDSAAAHRLMPVVHGHTLDELRLACQRVHELIPEPKQIGLGGLVPLLCSGGLVAGFTYRRLDGSPGDRSDFVADAIVIVKRHFPKSMLHVFGVGSTTTAISVLALGADSVDSLAWRRIASFGAILLPGTSERFPRQRQGRTRSRPVLNDSDLILLEACLCPVCRAQSNVLSRQKNLDSCYKRRAVHNAWTLLREVDRLRAALLDKRVEEFVRSRLNSHHRFFRPVSRMLAETQP